MFLGDCWVLAGPTASGKSHYAIELSQKFDCEIINADSMQLYSQLYILTSRPSPSPIPHHLYGIIETGASVAWWVDRACQKILDILSRGKKPIIVGGTGLYIHALTNGLSPMPEISPNIREKVRSLQDSQENFYKTVINFDPLIIGKIQPKDNQRLVRALEIFLQTRESITKQQGRGKPSLSLNFTKILINPDKEKLYSQINQRAETMMASGAIEEVKKLLQDYPTENRGVSMAIGVTEIKNFLENKTTFEQTLLLLQQATRQYAKRQRTWFSHQYKADFIIY